MVVKYRNQCNPIGKLTQEFHSFDILGSWLLVLDWLAFYKVHVLVLLILQFFKINCQKDKIGWCVSSINLIWLKFVVLLLCEKTSNILLNSHGGYDSYKRFTES